MYQSHGIGYAEYGQSFAKRMEIEQEREADHQKSLSVVNEHERKLST
ncbi:hypothetical protein [Pseudalkalibacillus caeni]|nr:hypothetical protein [Pseudalkalibacillus caeni]